MNNFYCFKKTLEKTCLGSHSRRPMRAAKTNRRNWTEMDRDEEEEGDDCVILNDHDYTSKAQMG